MENKKTAIGFLIFVVLITGIKNRFDFTVEDLKSLIKGNPKTELLYDNYDGSLFKVIKDGKTNYIDTLGRVVLKTDYDERCRNFSNGMAKVYNKDKYGYINKKGNLIIPTIYYDKPNSWSITDDTDFNDNHVFVRTSTETVFIDKMENTKFKYKLLLPVSWKPNDSTVVVGTLGKRGVVDYDGNMIIPQEYRFIGRYSEGLFLIQQIGEDLCGYINKNNEIVIKPSFSQAKDFQNGRAAVKVGEKWGVIDSKGNFVVSPIYDEINSFSEGLAKVVEDGKCGYIDLDGNIKIPINYENSVGIFNEKGNFKSGLALINKGEKSGWINKNGDISIEPIFDSASDFENGLAYVILNGKVGYVNTLGKIVYQEK